MSHDNTKHTTDEHCDVDDATDTCRGCGVMHGEPCHECGGRGFHRAGCAHDEEREAMTKDDDGPEFDDGHEFDERCYYFCPIEHETVSFAHVGADYLDAAIARILEAPHPADAGDRFFALAVAYHREMQLMKIGDANECAIKDIMRQAEEAAAASILRTNVDVARFGPGVRRGA